ncbi:MAG: capsule biosynthesis protein CapA [Candidatus Delongbacteria bacterium]|nr:capsule biosynthesis protein CapA [Candidatus Delongbacteria bacterium]
MSINIIIKLRAYFLFFIIVLLSSCSQRKELVNNIEEIPEQYLDEIEVSEASIPNYQKILQELHHIDAGSYTIKSGDKFNIDIYDEKELLMEGVIVKPDGTMSLKLIGEVKTGGMTIPEATQIIESKYIEFLKYPKISLSPYELLGSNFTIIGKVVHPGAYPINRTKLADAIAISGGLATGIFQNDTVEMADLEHSFVMRNGKILPVNFSKAIRDGMYLHNIPLMDGDYIYIPSSMNKEVIMLGEVNRPGYVGFKEALTLLQALSYAEGLKDTASDQLIVVRGKISHPRVFSIDISKILTGEILDFRLQPDDIIYIPKSRLASWNKIISLILPSMESVIKAKSIGGF